MERYEQLRDLLSSMNWVELSHIMENGMPMPGDLSKYYHDLWSSYELGDGCLSYQCILNEHAGTHVDAPAHMLAADSGTHIFIEENPVQLYSFPCVIILLDESSDRSFITSEDIKVWEEKHGSLRPGEGVFFRTGWDRKWKTWDPSQEFIQNWPGLSAEAASYLSSREIAAVGTDCLSIDSFSSDGCPAHKCLLQRNIPIFENLNQLDCLPARCYVLSLPLLIREGTASPVRVIALT